MIVLSGAGEELVSVLGSDGWSDYPLQFVGDGLLAAVRDEVAGAPDLARECRRRLEDRIWTGDRELAEALAAAVGDGPDPDLRELAVSLEELAEVLEGDPVHGGGRIDRQTGEVWPQSATDDLEFRGDEEEDEDDEDRWLYVESEGSRDGYRDMELFIADVEESDPAFAEELSRALGGRRPFRRFGDAVWRRPEQLTRWQWFSNDRHRGRARHWLAVEGITPTPPSSVIA